MLDKKLIISIFIFSFLLFCTSIVKNKTRVIEKQIFKFEKKIEFLEKNLYESQLDFYYLTSPNVLQSKILFLTNDEYDYMKFSKIYLDYESFFETLEEELTQLEDKCAGFHINPALEYPLANGGLIIEDEKILKEMERKASSGVEY